MKFATVVDPFAGQRTQHSVGKASVEIAPVQVDRGRTPKKKKDNLDRVAARLRTRSAKKLVGTKYTYELPWWRTVTPSDRDASFLQWRGHMNRYTHGRKMNNNLRHQDISKVHQGPEAKDNFWQDHFGHVHTHKH